MIECPREQDVVDAVATGRWPERADDELRDHVASCAICRDVAVVAHAMRADYDWTRRGAQVPPAGRVWWRAEMRARQEGARRAAQPIAAAIGLAAACAVGLLGALLQFAWPLVSQALTGVAAVTAYLFVPPVVLSLAVVLGVCVLVTPLALYLLLSDN